MIVRPVVVTLAASLVAASSSRLANAQAASAPAGATESRIAAAGASLYARSIGQGSPIVVLHGGPDFDHGYLLPELDRLADTYRLVYYDQRGRGRSADGVRPQDVTLASDLEDVSRVSEHFHLDAPALLGHSWGAVLALEYALRYPGRVSRLVLMNPAPVSTSDLAAARKIYLERLGAEMDRQRAIAKSPAYQAGDPETVAARYRIHFKPSLERPEDYERMMARMRAGFLRQGSAGILKARAAEEQLMRDTWELPSYDMLPRLAALRVPVLVIVGEHDFMAGAGERIARAIPGAQLVTIEKCGHFAFLECPDDVRGSLSAFFRAPR